MKTSSKFFSSAIFLAISMPSSMEETRKGPSSALELSGRSTDSISLWVLVGSLFGMDLWARLMTMLARPGRGFPRES